MSILLTLLILGVIILIHELGHFLAARMFKIPVSEFAIGMGPKLITFHGKATDYNLRLVPMGGFVNIEGMEFDKVTENGFNSKKAWQRFVVLFAGVFMNFILAFLISFGSTMAVGGEYKLNDNAIIGGVAETSKAKNILATGDKVLNIEGTPINKWEDLTKFMASNKKDKIEVEVLRAGEKLTKTVELSYNEERKIYLIGIEPTVDFRKYSFGESVEAGFKNYKELFKSVIQGFKMLVSGQVKADDMAGPIGLVKVVDDVKQNNSGFLIWLTALLSINVGIFNLLPFPALDGGRIIFVILEMFGIKISKKLEEKVHFVGIIILVGLFILITGNDIKKLF